MTFTGTDATARARSRPNATATLGIQGRLNDKVTDDDVNNDRPGLELR